MQHWSHKAILWIFYPLAKIFVTDCRQGVRSTIYDFFFDKSIYFLYSATFRAKMINTLTNVALCRKYMDLPKKKNHNKLYFLHLVDILNDLLLIVDNSPYKEQLWKIQIANYALFYIILLFRALLKNWLLMAFKCDRILLNCLIKLM